MEKFNFLKGLKIKLFYIWVIFFTIGNSVISIKFLKTIPNSSQLKTNKKIEEQQFKEIKNDFLNASQMPPFQEKLKQIKGIIEAQKIEIKESNKINIFDVLILIFQDITNKYKLDITNKNLIKNLRKIVIMRSLYIHKKFLLHHNKDNFIKEYYYMNSNFYDDNLNLDSKKQQKHNIYNKIKWDFYDIKPTIDFTCNNHTLTLYAYENLGHYELHYIDNQENLSNFVFVITQNMYNILFKIIEDKKINTQWQNSHFISKRVLNLKKHQLSQFYDFIKYTIINGKQLKDILKDMGFGFFGMGKDYIVKPKPIQIFKQYVLNKHKEFFKTIKTKNKGKIKYLYFINKKTFELPGELKVKDFLFKILGNIINYENNNFNNSKNKNKINKKKKISDIIIEICGKNATEQLISKKIDIWSKFFNQNKNTFIGLFSSIEFQLPQKNSKI